MPRAPASACALLWLLHEAAKEVAVRAQRTPIIAYAMQLGAA